MRPRRNARHPALRPRFIFFTRSAQNASSLPCIHSAPPKAAAFSKRCDDKSSRREPHRAPGVLDLLVDGRQHTGQTSSVRHSQRPVRPCRVPFRPREGKKIRTYPLARMRSDFVLRWCLWDSNPYVHGTADFPAPLCRHSRAGRCGLDYLFTVAVWP